MKIVNLILVYNECLSKILMCYRTSDPYKDHYNFLGGKLDINEDMYHGAYRELFEESGISKDDIKLIHFMDYDYPIDNLRMNIFYGILNKEVGLVSEKHPLSWIDLNEDFFNSKFAGDGNVYHMIQIANHYIKKTE